MSHNRPVFCEFDSRSKAVRLNWFEDVRLKLTLADLERTRRQIEVTSDADRRSMERRFQRITSARRSLPSSTPTSPVMSKGRTSLIGQGRGQGQSQSRCVSAVSSTRSTETNKVNSVGEGQCEGRVFDLIVEVLPKSEGDQNMSSWRVSRDHATGRVNFLSDGTKILRCRSSITRQKSRDQVSHHGRFSVTSPLHVRHPQNDTEYDVISPRHDVSFDRARSKVPVLTTTNTLTGLDTANGGQLPMTTSRQKTHAHLKVVANPLS